MNDDIQAGGTVGTYRLVAAVGEGAVGTVYRAIREPDGDVVAVKVMKPELQGEEVYRVRFRHEARAATSIQHPHLVPVVDAGEEGGRPYIVSSYVAGDTLAECLRRDRFLDVPEVLRLVSEVGAGLDALHAAGLIHRDVKPANIMVDENGAAALTDFGLAKGPAYTVLTRTGRVVGTPHYLAPELIEGSAATPASDVYALGCVAYECVAGSAPFAHLHGFEVPFGHLEEMPRNPEEGRSDLPPGFGAAVLEALAKDPQCRPPTGTAYAHLLRFACAGSVRDDEP